MHTEPETPNHALQRTATAVTARASAAAFPPAVHGPRQPPPSLSLGSLGAEHRMPRRSNTRVWVRVAPGIGFSRSMSGGEAGGFIGGVVAGRLLGRLLSTWAGWIVLPVFLPFILALWLLPSLIQLAIFLLSATISLIRRQISSPATTPATIPTDGSNSTLPQRDKPPPRKINYPLKCVGDITWIYSDGTRETFPVQRAIIHDTNTISMDCDCGTPHDPFIYTIQIHTCSKDDFFGSFTAGKSENQRTSGKVKGTLEAVDHVLRFRGVWIEGSKQSEWVGDLRPVVAFPDETQRADDQASAVSSSASEFKFSCPNCDQHILVAATLAGTAAVCPTCAHELIIPQPI